MKKEDLVLLEARCKNIYADLSSLLFWEWDSRLNIPLAEFSKEHSGRVEAILAKEFEKKWDPRNLSTAPDGIKRIVDALSGLRDKQVLYTTDPDSEAVLFATWWPWGNNEKISVRIGVQHKEKISMSEIELTINIRNWFNLL
jgi:hypothetical protein